ESRRTTWAGGRARSSSGPAPSSRSSWRRAPYRPGECNAGVIDARPLHAGSPVLCHDPALMPLAKTARPTLARTLARPRLFRLLDRAGQRPVTWVWAPPGAGKTTMVASYLAVRRRRALWYQIDAGDADAATFFYFLGRAAPRRRRPLPLLTAEYRQGLAVFARRFFRELYGRLPAPTTVVFDNYQEVPAGAALHEIMAEALAEIPDGLRLIVISRGEPPAELARHRAHQAIEIVEWPELRFPPLDPHR